MRNERKLCLYETDNALLRVDPIHLTIKVKMLL